MIFLPSKAKFNQTLGLSFYGKGADAKKLNLQFLLNVH